VRKILLLILLLFCFGYPNIALSDTCPEGTTPSYTCPDEFTLNQSTKICEANPRCTTGSYSSSLHKCVEQPTILGGGGALSFDGTDGNYVDCGNDESLNISNAITVAYWYKRFGGNTRQYTEDKISKRQGYNVSGCGSSRFFARIGGHTDTLLGHVSMPSNNVLYHIVHTYDSATRTAKSYCNGVLVDTRVLSGLPYYTIDLTSTPLTIAHPNAYSINGLIKEVRIYNRALSASEVEDLYNNPGQVSTDGLVGYWPLNEGSGNTATDKSGNGNDGTIHGATWDGSGEKTCPIGTSYDMVNDVCFISATCPSGGTLNTTSNKCELEPTLTCQQAPSPPLSGYYCFVDLNDNGAIEGDEYQQCLLLEDESYFCPLGSVECIDTYGEPICPSGSTLNPDTDKCEATPSISCSSGYTYNSDVDKCVMSISCPNGGSLNSNTDLCEIVVTSDLCPGGYTYNSGLDACTKTAVCPANGVYNSISDKCELPPDHSCSSGYTYNSSRDICEVSPTCSQGTYNTSTNRCEQSASAVCPSGYTYNSSVGKCVTATSCPNGGSLNTSRDKCETVYSHSCPSGYSYNSSLNLCQGTPICSSGTYNTSTNRCEQSASAVCPSGYTYNSSLGICVTGATCSNGGSLNTSRDKCEVAYTPACASGYTYNSSRDKCEANPTCPSGSSYNTTYNVCLKVVSSTTCPSGYSYNSSRQKCEANPTCPSGSSYNASTDRCEKSVTTTCPSGYSYNGSKCVASATPVRVYNTSGMSAVYNDNNGFCGAIEVSNGNIRFLTGWYWRLPWDGWTPQTPWISLTASSASICCYKRTEGWYNGCWYIEISNGNIRFHAVYAKPGRCLEEDEVGNCIKRDPLICDPYHGWCDTPGAWVPITGSGSSQVCNTCWEGYYRCCWKIEISNGNIRFCAWDWYKGWLCGDWVPMWTIAYNCPSGGSYNSSTGQCETSPSFSCPSGFTNVGGLCIVNPTCPSGGTLNTSVDKCQYTPTYNCDSGYTYDAAIGYCKINATCNSSGTLNTSVDKCQLPYSHSCPSGYSYNSSYGVCQKSPSCPTGGSYNTSRNQCEVDNSWNCPSGTTLSGSICYMSATCLYGGLNGSTDKCETAYTPTCPSGYSYNSSYGVCQKSPTCPSGSSYDNSLNQCVRANTWNCPSGMSLSGSTCYMSVYCPSGGSLNTDTELCEAANTLTCFTDGYTYSSTSNKCVSAPICNYGYFDTAIDLCRLSASGICPSTYTYNNDQNKCLLTPPCPSGALYSTTLNQCTIDATHDCPGDTLYSSLTRLCEAYPICEIGAYDPDHDGCYEGENTCPLGDYPCVNIDGVMKCSKNNCIDTGIGGSSNIEETSVDNTSYRDDGPRDADGVCLGQIYIFNGKGYQCRTSGVDTIFKNCCSSGIATKHQGKILLIIPQCNMSDAETDIRKDAGVCHYVGKFCSKKLKLLSGSICLQHKKSYCCFHSKLGRIIQEQGRPQLKTFGYSGDWGDPESPNCRGFTPEEFQMIDFDKIDLGEYFGDIAQQIQGKAAQIQQTEQQKISDFYQQTTGGN